MIGSLLPLMSGDHYVQASLGACPGWAPSALGVWGTA
eukprot:CAMPEP_0115881394 /NCGR_PEP_ID=MMETSP0287-20121206/28408_1 /TAXON_ID=412157 /ORGANISM="Chrysochromulina rotalis, Strain UIO044" /LENGTH=36 /DNA_ID= /DNA_START= /DNA_END= /DNA_ORIENTATION=